MSAPRPKHLSRLPLFPLPNAFLLPRTLMPLHVFEPRYRELAAWCIGRRWPLAIARIRPGHERYHLEAPPVEPIVGVGHIVHHERLRDGRYNVVVRGVARAHILEELPPEAPFRVARAELVADRWPDDPRELEADVLTTQACLASVRVQWSLAGEALAQAVRTRDAAHVADVVGATILTEPSDRSALLACADVKERIGRVVARLARMVAETASGEGGVQ